MVQFEYRDMIIEVYDEQQLSASDSQNDHTRIYFGEDAQEYTTSNHGIKVSESGRVVNSCLVAGCGGTTGVSEHSVLLDNDRLLVCCCNTLFCLSLPQLDLVWQVKADWATCFQVHILEGDYLVHGEIDISRITPDGSIVWKFSGADIFVSMGEGVSFSLEDDCIRLTDFNGGKYKLDFNGRLLDEEDEG